MSRIRPQWQLQALAAQKRDNELRRAEEVKKVASYFEINTNKSRHHEQWTTDGYYERANKEAELLSEKKIKTAQLEERRKKLENLLFQENIQYQQEIKALAAQPKYFKNGSYLNKVSTSTLQDINQGIMAKEEQMRKHEAELKLYHAWRLRQPEIRAASTYIANGKLKSAWMEQIVEKEIQKKKDEEYTRKIMQERDEALRKQIQIEQERQRQTDIQMKDLRIGLEDQIAELSEKETAVKKLRKKEETERNVLEELQYLSNEREKEHLRLVSERDVHIVNMGLHKYKLKRKVIAVIREIELELHLLDKMRKSVLKDYEIDREKCANHKRVLDEALQELEEHRERERQRQKHIETMYDGEARQINEKQDKLWAKEREARSILMKEVVEALRKQLQEKLQANIQLQRENVLEREKILEQMDAFHQEVRSKEKETQLTSSSTSTIQSLQAQLNSLRLQKSQMEDTLQRQDQLRAEARREGLLRGEIGRLQRAGSTEAWT